MRRSLSVCALVVAITLIVVTGPRLFVDVPRVGPLSFVNTTPYSMEVDVTGAGRDGWLPLGTARRGGTTQKAEVIDQGREWTFRFRAQGLEGGEMRVAKADLVRSQWRVVISEAIARRLAAQGAPPSPLRKEA
jgi:hypothetical protein